MPITNPQPAPKLSQRRIPTLLGLGFLVLGLVVGVIFIGRGSGVFAPRATPETTPKQVKITNITDNTFTVSFLTDDTTSGIVQYGTAENDLDQVAQDDKMAVSATTSEFQVHHITARGLSAGTKYFFLLKTGSGAVFDNNGSVFTVTTAQKSGTPAAAKTIYGQINTPSGGPANTGIVYVTPEGAGEMSVRISDNGSWAVPLSNARTVNGSGYAEITDTTPLRVYVQSERPGQTITHITSVGQAQPVSPLAFVAGTATEVASTLETEVTQEVTTRTETIEGDPLTGSSVVSEATMISTDSAKTDDTLSGEIAMTATETGSDDQTGRESLLVKESTSSAQQQDVPEVTVVSLESPESEQVTTTTPIIKGKAAANIQVRIEVHSDTQISDTVTTNANGEFEIDISQYEDELEPGEHTVTVNYTDPVTGEEKTTTKTFTVLAQANTGSNEQPYGTGNPYPIGGSADSATSSGSTPTPSPTASASASPVSTDSATPSGRTSMPSTASGIPVSGAIGTTLALIFGGAFFIISGVWSFWVSKSYTEAEVE